MRPRRLVLARAALWVCGCASLLTNTTLVSDRSHLGTAFSGTRGDLHLLTCFARDVSHDAANLILTPVMLFPLGDLPLSIAADVLLLPGGRGAGGGAPPAAHRPRVPPVRDVASPARGRARAASPRATR